MLSSSVFHGVSKEVFLNRIVKSYVFLRDEQDSLFNRTHVPCRASIRGIISLIDLGCANLDVWFVV